MISDFRKFIVRGNVIDLAVGIVIGAAFTSVVSSFVDDLLMPPIGKLTGGVDFANFYYDLSGGEYATLEAAREAGAPVIAYGLFLTNVISFLIVAFAVFVLVRAYERMRTLEAAEPPAETEKECPYCLLRVPKAASRCGHCTSEIAAAA